MEHHQPSTDGATAFVPDSGQALWVMPPYLTLREASQVTRVAEAEIVEATRTGQLAFYLRNKKKSLGFFRKDLEAWMASKRVALQPSPKPHDVVAGILADIVCPNGSNRKVRSKTPAKKEVH